MRKKFTLASAVKALFETYKDNANFVENRSLEARAYADIIAAKYNESVKVTSVERYIRMLRRSYKPALTPTDAVAA